MLTKFEWQVSIFQEADIMKIVFSEQKAMTLGLKKRKMVENSHMLGNLQVHSRISHEVERNDLELKNREVHVELRCKYIALNVLLKAKNNNK